MGWLLVCCCSWVDLGVGLSFGGVVSLLLFFGDLVVGLCFGSWVDVGVGFSFGGVALSVGDVSFIWMLICFGELVDVALGLVGLFFEEWCRRLVRFTGWALRCERSVQLYTSGDIEVQPTKLSWSSAVKTVMVYSIDDVDMLKSN